MWKRKKREDDDVEKSNRLAAAAQFGVTCDELKALNELRGAEALDRVGELGGALELCRKLRVEPNDGLSGAPTDLHVRVDAFGANVIPPKPAKTFLQLVFEAIQDTTLLVLIGAAIISLGLSFYQPHDEGAQSAGKLDEFSRSPLSALFV